MKISNAAATHITDFFINSGTISNDDKASYIYCFEYAIDTIIFPLTVLLSGLIFNRFTAALLFAVVIIPLKMSAGGAHASTRIMCSILSYSLYFVTLFCYQLLGNIPLTILNICYIICCVLIMYLSPVDHKNNRLASDAKHKLKKFCIIYVILISTVYTAFVYNDMSKCYLMINACMFIVVTNQIIGKLKH